MYPINRAALKSQAKASLAGKWGKAVLAIIIYEFIVGILTIPSTISALTGMLMYSNYDNYSSYYNTYESSFGWLFSIVAGILSVMLTIFFLHIVDGTDGDLGQEISSPFAHGKAGGTLINWFLTAVFTTLWSFLFVIPGIIASYAYSMSYYITEDWGNQGYKVKSTEAIKASKEMMRGHKGELFVLDLSFIGWYLLVGITFGLAGLYVLPYHQATRAAYYRALLAQQAQMNGNGAAPQGYAPQGYAPQGGFAPQGFAPQDPQASPSNPYAQNAPAQATQATQSASQSGAAQYGTPQYGANGQNPPAQQPYGQQSYSQQSYGQPDINQPAYGQPTQTAQPTQPTQYSQPVEPSQPAQTAQAAQQSTNPYAQPETNTPQPNGNTDFTRPESSGSTDTGNSTSQF
ncbi:DUF975 family protein [Alloscardovia criceti]|uniref:DUF975 family protein n=1 Tax=Alloscardovia criceti TaxID=356828 RepID=UPI00037A24DD|nr:DUF975 family protein [Alloscardovia criceti]